MISFRRMHELRWRTGTGERGGNFITDMPALSHSADNHSSIDRCEEIYRFAKAVVDSVL
jgi:hypothetical protein